MDTPQEVGVEVIARKLKLLPNAAGVYQMQSPAGDVLYIGKAKDLKKRVAAYTKPVTLPYRIQRMIAQVGVVEITTTRTEAEALLLEANLIKKHSPKYNILLRDDKSFPYIFISTDHPYPRIVKHRGARTGKGAYFGPFASGWAVNQTLAILQRAFLLRPCADTVFANRTRPCLQYQIKRCSAPCVQYVNEPDYAELVKQATDFLTGKKHTIQQKLAADMQTASDTLDFETAARLRDRIRALTQIQVQQGLHFENLVDADIVVLHRAGEACCVHALLFRSGQNFGSRSFYPTNSGDATDSEVMEAFLGRFYQNVEPPKEIILNVLPTDPAVMREALALRTSHKVMLTLPQRGDRKEALDLAMGQAKNALALRLAENASQRVLLEEVAKLFNLEGPPERIEVYDNSHIMGTNQVGAMIVSGTEGFNKSAYRKFNIRMAPTPGDDYAMMREVLTRRFKAAEEQDPDRTSGQWPDLVMIDGGPGQRSVTEQVFAELGITDVPFVCIAKGPDRNAGREQFYLPGQAPFMLPHDSPVLFFLQRLRDEAHRFAIGSHRQKRANSMMQSSLDSIPGIGGVRKKALLQRFGSVRAIEQATVDDLLTVPGINHAIAEQIYGFFHP